MDSAPHQNVNIVLPSPRTAAVEREIRSALLTAWAVSRHLRMLLRVTSIVMAFGAPGYSFHSRLLFFHPYQSFHRRTEMVKDKEADPERWKKDFCMSLKYKRAGSRLQRNIGVYGRDSCRTKPYYVSVLETAFVFLEKDLTGIA